MVISTMKKPAVKITVSDSSAESENEESEHSSDEQMSPKESDDQSGDEGDVILANEGWADSVAKILSSSKPKNKKTLVLSRAKKHSEIKHKKEEKPAFEVVGEINKDEKEIKIEETVSEEPSAKKKKQEKPTIRAKPNILEKDRERLLAKIATKGVVQLFNAVRNQQKTIEKELDKDLTESKKEKILKKFDKRAFLDTLMGQTKSIIVDEQTKSLKNEVKPEEEKPKWNALRDDFMMGAKMKDWDKEPADD